MARSETGRAGPVAVPRGGTGVRAAVQREERAVSAERGPGLDRLPRDVQLGSKVQAPGWWALPRVFFRRRRPSGQLAMCVIRTGNEKPRSALDRGFSAFLRLANFPFPVPRSLLAGRGW